eukprot:CAMPEP_0178399840 /NCGR_PEP_ID=MMETSP0689_2-20121128/15484_1 /TAXON_ID=160604 /ORGANISM="Amphidinium massartii, Strain CS-259" /LENGTH=378 /DNA_ID=CAMNT_0020020623 /DNA_START=167 /DNA_END=1303 /DNA_ORIENTATION=+
MAAVSAAPRERQAAVTTTHALLLPTTAITDDIINIMEGAGNLIATASVQWADSLDTDGSRAGLTSGLLDTSYGMGDRSSLPAASIAQMSCEACPMGADTPSRACVPMVTSTLVTEQSETDTHAKHGHSLELAAFVVSLACCDHHPVGSNSSTEADMHHRSPGLFGIVDTEKFLWMECWCDGAAGRDMWCARVQRRRKRTRYMIRGHHQAAWQKDQEAKVECTGALQPGAQPCADCFTTRGAMGSITCEFADKLPGYLQTVGRQIGHNYDGMRIAEHSMGLITHALDDKFPGYFTTVGCQTEHKHDGMGIAEHSMGHITMEFDGKFPGYHPTIGRQTEHKHDGMGIAKHSMGHITMEFAGKLPGYLPDDWSPDRAQARS